MSRNLNLNNRIVSTREARDTGTVLSFTPLEILKRFCRSFKSIKDKFDIAIELKNTGKIDECEDIWRTQIVFLESILDFYIHEISKYGMCSIFNEIWKETEQYKKFYLPMSYVKNILDTQDKDECIRDYTNKAFSIKVYLDPENIKDQFNLLGLNIQEITKEAFPDKSDPYNYWRKFFSDLYKRRSQIVHQNDQQHNNAQRNDIDESYVHECMKNVRLFVYNTHKAITIKDASSNY